MGAPGHVARQGAVWEIAGRWRNRAEFEGIEFKASRVVPLIMADRSAPLSAWVVELYSGQGRTATSSGSAVAIFRYPSSTSSTLAMFAAPTRTAARIASAPTARVVQPGQSAGSRGYHDLVIKRKTGQALVKAGPFGGGRSSVSGHVATVFGCTGFLGRYLVNRLGRKGTQVVVPYRDEDRKRHLRVASDLGQIVPTEFDVRREDQILESLRHSDIVYNLVGRWWETKNFSFEDVNVKAAERIAKLANEAGCARLVHVSHLNAAEDAPSDFLRTKWEGEQRVKEAFPGATIVRPGPMYGHEDRLLNSIASTLAFLV